MRGTAVIFGAGPAGLAAGLALSRAGWSVQVYEQAPAVGGLARTVTRDGFRFDLGGHRWFTKKDELNLFLIDLLGDELVLVNRTSRVYFDGKYVDYPLRLRNVMSSIGPATSARALGDFVASQASQLITRSPVVSMEDAYVAQFGRTLYDLFFRRYSEKVWGNDCQQLSGDWVAQRSRGLTLLTTLRQSLRRTSGNVESLVDRFMYPRLGYGRISERMAEETERAGGRVHLGCRVLSVQHDGRAITGATVSDGVREWVIEADEFISSIPMTELVQILSPAADGATLALAGTLTYRALMTVHLMLDRPQVTNDTWIYVHDPSVSFARLHEPRNWSPDLAPPGKTSLVLEFFCEAGDALWRLPDADLCELAVHELATRLGFIQRSEVIDGFVVRSRDAYPRYALGYREAVDGLKAYLRSYPNLSLVGRGGTFRYNNADHAIETGLLSARKVLGETVDMDAVNSQAEYLEQRGVPSARADVVG
jgi:protoporphyrinogen oxidase